MPLSKYKLTDLHLIKTLVAHHILHKKAVTKVKMKL